jgi:hypothetical protein
MTVSLSQLLDCSFQIVWEYLERTGELGDGASASRFLSDVIGTMIRQGQRRSTQSRLRHCRSCSQLSGAETAGWPRPKIIKAQPAVEGSHANVPFQRAYACKVCVSLAG